jgi:molybdenum cofactor cytidylyltransferase
MPADHGAGDIAAIVLAAGYSSRMGSFKPLIELGSRTFLERAVGAFASVGVDDVIVVTGYRGDQVGTAAERLGARAVANPEFERGMYSSLQAGAAALSPSVRRFFVLPVDCPLVRPETIGRLARAGQGCDAEVVLPAAGGEPGHPPLLSAALRAEILAAEPPGGLRGLIAARTGRSVVIPVGDPNVIVDADTLSDLARLQAAASREDLPSERRCHEILSEQWAGHPAGQGVAAHSRAVAGVAAALTTALNERHQHLCLPLVVGAALLHDVARAQPHHAVAGAAFIEGLGYPRVAELVSQHMDLPAEDADDLGEAAVLYLADKLVFEDRLVSLERRSTRQADRLQGDSVAQAAARLRIDVARRVHERMEAALARRLTLVRHEQA